MIFIVGVVLGFVVIVVSELTFLLTSKSPEVSRKTLHLLSHFVLISLYCLGVSVGTAFALSVSWALLLSVIKLLPKGHRLELRSLSRVDRQTFGGVFLVCSFAPMIFMDLSLFVFIGSYSVSALADINAAYIGQAYGRRYLFRVSPTKTLLGSLAFFVTSVLCLSFTFVILQGVLTLFNFLLIVLISIILAVVENLSSKGLDNLFVPILCAILLQYL